LKKDAVVKTRLEEVAYKASWSTVKKSTTRLEKCG